MRAHHRHVDRPSGPGGPTALPYHHHLAWPGPGHRRSAAARHGRHWARGGGPPLDRRPPRRARP
eukprot:3194939-Lingulodinium_polyedra.AAC.1